MRPAPPEEMTPRVRGFEDVDRAIRVIARTLLDGDKADFTWDHYSAFHVVISPHVDDFYALSVSYTGRPAHTVIWHADRHSPGPMSRSLMLAPGHDEQTIARLLRRLVVALADVAASAHVEGGSDV